MGHIPPHTSRHRPRHRPASWPTGLPYMVHCRSLIPPPVPTERRHLNLFVETVLRTLLALPLDKFAAICPRVAAAAAAAAAGGGDGATVVAVAAVLAAQHCDT